MRMVNCRYLKIGSDRRTSRSYFPRVIVWRLWEGKEMLRSEIRGKRWLVGFLVIMVFVVFPGRWSSVVGHWLLAPLRLNDLWLVPYFTSRNTYVSYTGTVLARTRLIFCRQGNLECSFLFLIYDIHLCIAVMKTFYLVNSHVLSYRSSCYPVHSIVDESITARDHSLSLRNTWYSPGMTRPMTTDNQCITLVVFQSRRLRRLTCNLII